MESSYDLCNVTDLSAYKLPLEDIIEQTRSENDFKNKKLIGDGTYSRVYVANDDKTGKPLALKILKGMHMASPLSREAFREITILRNLDHDNIVRLQEVVVAGELSSTCLVMDFYSTSLENLIDKYNRPISPIQIKCIIKQLLSGISYLHSNYVMHRDLKPANLMISDTGTLKIIDFGLSCRFSHQNLPSSPNVMTRWYQAPELLLGAPNYGPGVDIWSTGCILAELYQRKPLLKGESEIQQINLVIDLIGTPDTNSWPGYAKCRVFKTITLKKQVANKIGDRCFQLGCSDALELIGGMFVYNPDNRLSAEDCLRNAWLHKAPFPAKTIELPAQIRT